MAKKGKGKKGKSLTGLAAALVKSGHLSEKKAKRIQREQRRDDKSLGRDGVAEREAAKQVEIAARRAAEAEAARERQRALEDQATTERARRALSDGLEPISGGRRRWYFVSRDRTVRFLDLSDTAAQMLRGGQAGIVESLGLVPDAYAVVSGERSLQTLVGIDPELVRFWNRTPPPPREARR